MPEILGFGLDEKRGFGFWVSLMVKNDKIKYWLKTADQDWRVANHLFEKGDYSYALFFGHLTIEKILKAIFINKKDKTPPFSHNLVYLSGKRSINPILASQADYEILAGPASWD